MSTQGERLMESGYYTDLLRTGQSYADGTAAQCETWRKLMRAAARADKVKIATGRCLYLTREGNHRAWAITPERPHGSATDAEVEARHAASLERLDRMFEPGTPENKAANDTFPWVAADWTTG